LKSSIKTLKADLQYGDIHINVADVNVIKVEAFIDINDGEWNDNYEFEVKEENGYISILGELDMDFFKNKDTYSKNSKWGNWNTQKEDEREVIIAGKSYTYEKKAYQNNENINVDIMIAVTIPENMVLEITTLYGSSMVENLVSDIRVNATYGSIDTKCSPKLTATNIKLNSTYAAVDLTIPANIKADLYLKSGYGSIYTDLNFQPTFKGTTKECRFGEEISAKINGGGLDIDLNSGYANLYLRKL
jgi:hypothetical protein